MNKLLITGFDPFGGESINPSWEAVRMLPEQIGEYKLTKLQIPTEFERAAKMVLETAEKEAPDVILCIGQAGGRSGVTPEVIGINLREARIPDNAGFQPQNEPVDPQGPAAYFSTVPVREMVESIRAAQIPAALSFSAGAFVCNDVLYSVLRDCEGKGVRAGFVHVPFLPEQAKEGVPSLPLAQIVTALSKAIEAL